jgi:hypothetical protein
MDSTRDDIEHRDGRGTFTRTGLALGVAKDTCCTAAGNGLVTGTVAEPSSSSGHDTASEQGVPAWVLWMLIGVCGLAGVMTGLLALGIVTGWLVEGIVPVPAANSGRRRNRGLGPINFVGLAERDGLLLDRSITIVNCTSHSTAPASRTPQVKSPSTCSKSSCLITPPTPTAPGRSSRSRKLTRTGRRQLCCSLIARATIAASSPMPNSVEDLRLRKK